MHYEVVWDLVRPWITTEAENLFVEEKHALANAIKSIHQRLTKKPLSFGEAHFKYKATQLIYCIAIHRGLGSVDSCC